MVTQRLNKCTGAQWHKCASEGMHLGEGGGQAELHAGKILFACTVITLLSLT